MYTTKTSHVNAEVPQKFIHLWEQQASYDKITSMESISIKNVATQPVKSQFNIKQEPGSIHCILIFFTLISVFFFTLVILLFLLFISLHFIIIHVIFTLFVLIFFSRTQFILIFFNLSQPFLYLIYCTTHKYMYSKLTKTAFNARQS